MAGLDGAFVSIGACNLEVPCSNPGQAGYLSSWLCIYSAPNFAWRVYSAAYGTVHYQQTLKSFEIRVGHSMLRADFCLDIAMISCRRQRQLVNIVLRRFQHNHGNIASMVL